LVTDGAGSATSAISSFGEGTAAEVKQVTLRQTNIAMEEIHHLSRCISYKKLAVFHCYVSLPEGSLPKTNISPRKSWLEDETYF